MFRFLLTATYTLCKLLTFLHFSFSVSQKVIPFVSQMSLKGLTSTALSTTFRLLGFDFGTELRQIQKGFENNLPINKNRSGRSAF